MKNDHAMIGTTKLAIKYFLERMVSSTNKRVGMIVILGLSHQFIQMGQSEFNADGGGHQSNLISCFILYVQRFQKNNNSYFLYAL